MKRRQFLASIGAPALLLPQAQSPSDHPPNIVFIYTDDQARWAVSSYGNRDVHSPNLDRIAREGALFERSFVCTPVCSASRAGLLTGQPSFRTGVRDFIDVRREPELGLSTSFPSWPQLLQEAGYTTALFGKWHLGTRPEHHPTQRGYTQFTGFLEGGNTPMDPWLEVGGKEQRVKGSLPDFLTDSAIEFIKKNQKSPFLVSLHFRAPHSPYGPVPPQDAEAVAGRQPAVPEGSAIDKAEVAKLLLAYYASIASIDRNVGRVLETLDTLGLTTNTVVVFTSDNGYMIGQHGGHGKGNATRLGQGADRYMPNMFDESILTPLAIRWPKVVKPGTRISEMITNLDFFPTLLAIAGASGHVPHNYAPAGRDLSPLLRGERIPWRDVVFGDYDMYHYVEDSMRMIRTAEWKLVTHSNIAIQHELYDLKNDPGERRNLIGNAQHSTTMRALRRRLFAWQEWSGDPRRVAPAQPM